VFVIYFLYLIFANWFTGLFKDIEWFLLFYIRPVDIIEFLSIVGILLSAILSGYGSTQCILNYLVYPFLKGKIIFILDYFEQQNYKCKMRMEIIQDEISMKENEISNLEMSTDYTLATNGNNSNIIISSIKGVFNYITGKNKKRDVKLELEELKVLYSEMEMQFKMLKEKTVIVGYNFISRLKYFCNNLTGQILAVYSIYRIIMTVKNLLFQNYSDINIMLRDQVLNIIDFTLSIVFHILRLDIETIYYTVIEQYFSLIIVGSIIITNIRAFLNTILFIYTKTLKKYNTIINKKVQLIFLSYFVGLFYVTSSIFLIFNLPITYR
jgi:hypothetical protein